jgi:hypothetical protein
VRAAGRNIQRDLLVVSQLEALPAAVRRRTRSQVDDHIEDRAIGTPHQLRFAAAAAQVQASHHAASGTGQAVLDECRYLDTAGPRDVRIEGAAEESALVDMRCRSEQERPGDLGDSAYVHRNDLNAPIPYIYH